MTAARGRMRLHDTLRGEIVPVEPAGPTVTVYVCGITPYDSTHLGHAATYVAHDLIVRRLEDLGHDVVLVRNFTDVDDSILPKASQLGVDFLDLAATEIARFRDDMVALNTRPAAHEPRATESIDWMIAIIEKLVAGGHAYSVDGYTFFEAATHPTYGALSKLGRDDMIALARERGGRPDDPRQRDPLDFVLWQPSSPGEPSWDSPWGPGRPGWHIECTAMSTHLLGDTIDLHGGGGDLVYPHHECEIAQGEAASGQPFARHWVHCGLVGYEGEKMSKSRGNLVFVSDLLKAHDPRAVRIALLGHHYRSEWEWFDDEIVAAAADLERLVSAASAPSGPGGGGLVDEVRAALDDDLDTPTVRELLVGRADAILAGGDDPEAPGELTAAAALVGIDLV